MKRPSSLDNFRMVNGQLVSLEDFEEITGQTVQRSELTTEEFQYLMGTVGIYDVSFYDEE